MGGGRGQAGQATVEWVGLVLAVGLMLGALAGGVRGATGGDAGEGGRGLGEAVAERITCAARDLCGTARRPASSAPRSAPSVPPPPRAAPRQPPQRSGSADGPLPRLGRAGSLAEHAWIACLGYRTLRDDLENPRTPRQARPVERTLEIVNECLNPWEFFFGD